MRFSNWGSKMGIMPFFKRSIFCVSISTQITVFPASARQAAVTNPTYPEPKIANFTLIPSLIAALPTLQTFYLSQDHAIYSQNSLVHSLFYYHNHNDAPQMHTLTNVRVVIILQSHQ